MSSKYMYSWCCLLLLFWLWHLHGKVWSVIQSALNYCWSKESACPLLYQHVILYALNNTCGTWRQFNKLLPRVCNGERESIQPRKCVTDGTHDTCAHGGCIFFRDIPSACIPSVWLPHKHIPNYIVYMQNIYKAANNALLQEQRSSKFCSSPATSVSVYFHSVEIMPDHAGRHEKFLKRNSCMVFSLTEVTSWLTKHASLE